MKCKRFVLRFMVRAISRAAIPAFVLLLLTGVWDIAHAQTLVVQGGTLIDGTGRAPIKNAVVVIEGNRFKAVGVKGKVAIPPGAKVINADGKTILPGLIDSQVGGSWAAQPPIWLHFGVTTVYYNAGCAGGDVGRALGKHREEKAAFEKGVVPGPRMYLPIGYFDGPIDLLVPDRREQLKPFPLDRGFAISVQTPKEAVAAVDRLFAGGGEDVAVFEGVTPELLRAFSGAAHEHGLVVEGRSEFASMTSENGQDITCYMGGIVRSTITNPANLAKLQDMKQNHWQLYWKSPIGNYEYMMEPAAYDSLIQKMVRNHVYFSPAISHAWWIWGTQIPHSREWEKEVIAFAKQPGLDFVPPKQRSLWLNADRTTERVKGDNAVGDQWNATHPQDLDGYAKQDEFLRRFVKAGGKIMGGGGNNDDMVPGLVTHQELQQLVYSGLTPMEAILSVTKWPAEAFHKEKDLGSVEPGKLADLITVNGDPLVDIRNTRNVETVIVNGKVVDIAFNSNYKPPIPVIKLDRAALQFGSQKIHSPSAPQSVTLTNVGTATLNINHIENSEGFTETNDCRFEGDDPVGLPPGESCKIVVTFTPTAAGPVEGTIAIAGASADLYDTPHAISVTGNGLQ